MASNDQNKQGGKSGSQQSDTSKRGFASMDPAQQREIAAEGGRAAHAKGTAHEFTSEEARRAGAMSHKNDAGRSRQSAASPGNAARTNAGNSSAGNSSAGANAAKAEDLALGNRDSPAGAGGGSRSGGSSSDT
ncbi:Stress-induced acidophilic repeat motif-containing protein [Duganella sacchari]|uniref:Stress-induced acidophilic repeat motif-containing protein n=1 Tax=Duganella sacchari TaxID=551987 RepID=A0A1M7ILM0_9BURK|nr:KGG domain-containing protein [Duganella sacchari]SHM41498.1 Stress-induced acidophilic repeat motif-containing protein [Duganella sacchari]